jgi:hypothetical protein
MANIRRRALKRLAAGQDPVRHSWASVMIYLEDYQVEELRFDPIGK